MVTFLADALCRGLTKFLAVDRPSQVRPRSNEAFSRYESRCRSLDLMFCITSTELDQVQAYFLYTDESWTVSRQVSLPPSPPPTAPPPPPPPPLQPLFADSSSANGGTGDNSRSGGAGAPPRSPTAAAMHVAASNMRLRSQHQGGLERLRALTEEGAVVGRPERPTTLAIATDSPSSSSSGLPSPVSGAHNGSSGDELMQVRHGQLRKHLSTAFIPPQFPSPSDGNALIKPSEYLKTVAARQKSVPPSLAGSKIGSLQASREDLTDLARDDDDSASSTTSNDSGIVTTSNGHVNGDSSGMAPAPPPPPMPSDDQHHRIPTAPPTPSTPLHPSPNSTLAQPLAAIRLQDLQKVQLRKTDKPERVESGYIVPGNGLRTAVSSENLLESKSHLIEELKMSKDIQGIKKLKEEKVKKDIEQEKQRKDEIMKQYQADNFVEKIPENDQTGQPIPPWKRQMLAKKVAEKAKKEAEEQRLREEEERRLQAIPVWKRQLLQKKEGTTDIVVSVKEDKQAFLTNRPAENNRRTKTPATVSVTEETKQSPVIQINPAKADFSPPMVISESSPPKENGHKETNGHSQQQQQSDETARQQNPWMFQLRKTNSKLFLNS